jgi:hypothetical protein
MTLETVLSRANVIAGSNLVRRSGVVSALLALAIFAGCGGGGDHTAPSSLKDRLLPVSRLPGFKVSRTFEWDNPTDVFVQGLFTSETTTPSDFIHSLDKAGFDAGVGEHLQKRGNQGPQGFADVLKFGSDGGAQDALALMHKEDLKQPCFSACSENPSAFNVDAIPGAKAAQQVPLKNPPKGAGPPFVGYAVEFPIRSYVYIVNAGGPPGSVTKSEVTKAAKAYYDHATTLSNSGSSGTKY